MKGAEMADELFLVVAKLFRLELVRVEGTALEGALHGDLVAVQDVLVLLLHRVLFTEEKKYWTFHCVCHNHTRKKLGTTGLLGQKFYENKDRRYY